MVDTEREEAGPQANEAPAAWWKCVVAALPELFIGLQFLAAARTGKPFLGSDPGGLTAAMQAEFLVIHSMAFLGVVALWKPKDAKGERQRAGVFVVLFLLYAIMSLSGGFKTFVIFFGMTSVTYLGLLLNWNSPSAMLQLGARWGVGFILFLAAIGIFGVPSHVNSWPAYPYEVLRAGAFYFLALATVELTGLYLRAIPRLSRPILDRMRSIKDSAVD